MAAVLFIYIHAILTGNSYGYGNKIFRKNYTGFTDKGLDIAAVIGYNENTKG